MSGKGQASLRKIRENRSTTHIRIKKTTKFQLEKWMKKHHCKTYNQAINRLLELSGAAS